MKNDVRHTSSSVPQHISSDIEVLPDNESLDGTKFKSLEGIVNTEAVSASVLADFVEVFLDELLLLHKFHIGQ